MVTTVVAGNTRNVDLSFNRGIDGSSAISAIQEGFCVNMENADLSTVGVIRKRAGYNVYNHKLPVKYHVTHPYLTNKRDLDYSRLFTITFRAYPNTKEIQNSFGLQASEDDLYNTMLCNITSNLPEGFVLNMSHMFKINYIEGRQTEYNQVAPISVLGPTLFTLPRNTIADYTTNGAFDMSLLETKGYLEYSAMIVTGYSLAKITSDSISTITQVSTTVLNIEFTSTPELSLNDRVFFESGAHLDPATEYTGITLNNPSGVVTSITGNVVTITFAVSTLRGDYLEENVNNQYKTPTFIRIVPTSQINNLVVNSVALRAGYSTAANEFILIRNKVSISTASTVLAGVVTFTGPTISAATLTIATGVLSVTLVSNYFDTSDELILKYQTITGTVGYSPVTAGTITNRNVSLRYCPKNGIFVVYDVNNNVFKYDYVDVYSISVIKPNDLFDSEIVIKAPLYIPGDTLAGVTITDTVKLRSDRYQDVTRMYLVGYLNNSAYILGVGYTLVGNILTFRQPTAYTIPGTQADRIYWTNIIAGYGITDLTSGTIDLSTGLVTVVLSVNVAFADKFRMEIVYYEENFNPTISPAFFPGNAFILPGYIYGLNAQIGLVEAVGVLNNNETVVGYNGNLFAEKSYTSTNLTTNVGLYCLGAQSISAVAGEITIPARYKRGANASSFDLVTTSDYYIQGDYASVSGFTLLVKSVTATDIVVDAGGLAVLNILAYEQIEFIRTSKLVYLKDFSYLNMEFLSNSSTLQIGDSGRDYPFYVINRVQSNYIELTEAITYGSNQELTLGNVFIPLWHGDPIVGDYLPISQDKYIGESQDIISSIEFNKSLYFAYGANGIWRYDGISLENMKLPAPVNCYMRSIPNTFGFLPTVKDVNKVICFPVTVIVTYSYVNDFGQEIESPVTSELGMTISANAVNDGSLSSEVVEIQIPSVRYNSTFKTDLTINIYRNGWYSTDTLNDANFRLDVAVPNNPDAPYTRAFIGTYPGSTASTTSEADAEINSKKQLYSSVSIDAANNNFLPTNINPPLATKLVTFNNQLLAFNGSEDNYFNFRCLKVFGTDNKFGAYSLLRYSPTGTNYEQNPSYAFHTVTLGVNEADVITVGTDSTINKHINGTALNPKWLSLYRANNIITKVDYADTSNRFTVTDGAALSGGGIHVLADDNQVILRAQSALPTDLPIDLTNDEFLIDYVGTTAILYSSKSRWTAKENTAGSFLPSALTGKDKFVMFRSLGASVPASALDKVFVANSNNTSVMYLYLTTGTLQAKVTAVAADVNGKYIVIKGPGVLGNIQLDNSTIIQSWDRDLIFKVETGTGPAIVGATCFNLTPVKVGTTATAAVAWNTSTILFVSTINSTAYTLSIYAVQVNITPAVNFLPVSGFTNPVTTAEVTFTTPGAGNVDIGDSFEISPQPDSSFIPLNYPNLSGTFAILSGAANPYKITIVPPKAMTMRTSTVTLTPAGSKSNVINSSKISNSIDVVNGYLRIKFTPVTGSEWQIIPPYVFILIRGDLYNSVSLQLSGWHKVSYAYKDAGNTYCAIVTETKVDTIDYVSLNTYTSKSYPLSGVLYLVNTSLAGGGEQSPDTSNLSIPIPVPFSIADTTYSSKASDQKYHGTLHDLAMPLFAITSIDNTNPLNLVSKRFAGAINSTMSNIGFAYWGGSFGTFTEFYPAGGFKFVPHRSSTNKYRHVYKQKDLTYPTLPAVYYANILPEISKDEYTNPQDKWNIRTKNIADYQVYGSIKTDSNVFTPQTYNNIATGINYTTFVVIDPQYLSRVWPTQEYFLKNSTNRRATQTAFKNISALNIGAGDGQSLTGAVTFANIMLMFKANSIYRLGILRSGAISDPDKVQSTVGTIAGNNIIANEDSCFFIHYTGVYKTNAVDLNPVLVLNRPFIDRVAKYSNYFQYTTGFHDALTKEIHLGIPLDSPVTDSQFLYNYNDLVQGWSINTNIPATKWGRVNNIDVFGSLDDGYIYRIRTETTNTKFSDIQAGIPFKLQTRYLSTDEVMTWKFYKNVMFMFGSRYPNTPTISYAWDYAEAFDTLQVFHIKDQRYGTSEFGKSVYGTTKHIEFRRRNLPTTRVANIALLIEESSAATPFEIYRINIEGFVLNTKYIRQNVSK